MSSNETPLQQQFPAHLLARARRMNELSLRRQQQRRENQRLYWQRRLQQHRQEDLEMEQQDIQRRETIPELNQFRHTDWSLRVQMASFNPRRRVLLPTPPHLHESESDESKDEYESDELSSLDSFEEYLFRDRDAEILNDLLEADAKEEESMELESYNRP